MHSPVTVRLIHKMYIAHYGRAADPLGLKHWTAWYEKNNDLELMRQHFSASPEWDGFCAETSTKQLIKYLFKQMFDRKVDKAGLRYYLSLDPQGTAAMSEIALKIAEGAAGIDLVTLEKKISSAIKFCAEIEKRNKVYDISGLAIAGKFLARVGTGSDDSDIDRYLRNSMSVLPDRVISKNTQQQKKKLYLHIGSDKTGSTAIQYHMHKNIEWLAQRDIFVPPRFLDRENGYASLFQNLSGDNLQDFVNEIDASSLTSALVSWEGIHVLLLEDLKLLFEYINHYELVIIYYIREQAEIMQTGAFQVMKQERQPIDFLTKQELRMPKVREYEKIVNTWTKVFPAANFKLVVYDRGQLKGNDVVEDFFYQLGSPIDDEFSKNNAEINPSLDFYSAQVLSMLESTSGFEKLERIELVNSLLKYNANSSSNEKYFYSKEQVEKIQEHYYDSNKRLLDRFGIGVDGLVSKKRVWRSSASRADVIARISSIFDHLENDFMRSILSHGQVYGPELAKILGVGWYPINHQIAWSQNNRSIITIQLDESKPITVKDTVCLEISGSYASTIYPMTALFYEGEHLGDYDLSQAKIMIPSDKIRKGDSISITLVHPTSIIPAEVGLNEDTRNIAYALRSFDIGISKCGE
ncbi:MAG: hypothetical protein ACI89U_003038 [Gammaproteobacteria bacterium]|jgi:hypothetical protein